MENIEKILDNVNQMLSMHSKKRDELKRRSWILESFTVVSSVILCSTTFYNFGNSFLDELLNYAMKGFSIISVICSLMWLHSTCKPYAEKHQEATRQFAKLKKELETYRLENDDSDEIIIYSEKRIAEISNIIQISEKDFIRLKQYCERKEYYRKHIKEHLSIPYHLAVFLMWKQLHKEEKKRGSK